MSQAQEFPGMPEAGNIDSVSLPVAANITDDASEEYATGVRNDEATAAMIWAQKRLGESAEGDNSGQGGGSAPAAAKAQGEKKSDDNERGFFSTAYRNVSEIPGAVGHGVVSGINEAVQTVYEVADWMREHMPEWTNYSLNADFSGEGFWPDISIDKGAPIGMPQLPGIFDDPETATGEIASKISQFLTGFVSGGRLLKGAQATTTGGRFAKAAAQGGIADFAFFDGLEPRLANLMQDLGVESEWVDYLAADEGDSQLEGKLKNALEGFGLGALTEGVLMVAKTGRQWLRAKGSAAGAAEERLSRAAAQETPPTAIEVLGEPDGQLIRTANPEDVLENALAPARRSMSEWSGEPDNLYINFARIDSPEDVQEIIQRSADLFKPSIDAARRGVRTFDEIALSAEKEDAWRVLMDRRAGDPLNAEKSLALRNLWASSGDKLAETARFASQAPTEENLFAFRKMLAIHDVVQKEVVAARTETARALASWRIPAGPRELRVREMEDIINGAPGGARGTRQLADYIARLDEAGMSRELETLVGKSQWALARDSVQEYWIMSLLSGPKTHLVNMMSNTFVAFQQVFERGVAAQIGRALGDDGGVQLGEAMTLLNGQLGGIKDGLRLAGKAFIKDQGGGWASKIDLPHNPAISAEGWGLAKDTALGKTVDVLGKVIRLPGRALMAEDEFFKTVGYRSEMHALAYRQATREAAAGKIGKEEIRSRMVDILENPPDSLKVAAVDHAAYSTFTKAPGEFAQKWLRMTQAYPALRFVTPFVKTPANIFNYTVAERSPFAPLFRSFREDVAAGGARQQLALARVSTGTATMLLAGDLAFNGQITGGGPPNQAQKQTLMRTGWQPYSVKVGDRYFSYARTDPLGMSFGIAADLAEIVNHVDQQDKEVDADEAAVYFAASIAGNTMSKSYMRGLSDLVEVLTNPRQGAAGYGQRFAGSFVPSGLAEASRFNDPYMLEINSMIDAMKARIPGLSEDLPARRDLWGRAISYRSGLGAFYDAISPIASRRENPEPIDEEMLRMEAYVAAPGKRQAFDGVTVDLTRPEFSGAYSRFAELAGNELKHPAWGKGCMDMLNDTVTGKGPLSSVYGMRSDGPEGGKSEFIRAKVYEYREMARGQLLLEYPELRAYVDAKKAEKPGKWDF